ncbi:hypothetical protein [Cytobacillus sp. IB215665]|uniref:hypothetical protein n=1 Tax=Cytobacillus sp. IB215665 TaxID=3097357 RepID=UPI002A0AEA35|nr:hypothetical protein [Cytobacillus sp. IB215665]MDX8365362.1 hypothetical protein [Cytobacillus sp. IB215665]
MSEIILLSIFAFLLLTYKYVMEFRNKDVAKNNKLIAWLLYSVSIVGLVAVNILL